MTLGGRRVAGLGPPPGGLPLDALALAPGSMSAGWGASSVWSGRRGHLWALPAGHSAIVGCVRRLRAPQAPQTRRRSADRGSRAPGAGGPVPETVGHRAHAHSLLSIHATT